MEYRNIDVCKVQIGKEVTPFQFWYTSISEKKLAYWFSVYTAILRMPTVIRPQL